MKENASIPVYSLKEKNLHGPEILLVESFQEGESFLQDAHRDEHYILVFQEKGSSRVMVDFKEILIEGCAVFCILPGQVHYGISASDSLAWFMATDASWVGENFRQVFQEASEINAPVPLGEPEAALLKKNILLLKEAGNQNPDLHFILHTLRSLTDACLSIICSFYYQKTQSGTQAQLRTSVITRQFKSLLSESFRNIKNPSDYAAALNISPSWLNEAVKESTGYPVSYWIQQEVILEAKRMLFYTGMTVKEIAHELGYEDASYFIRLFGKTAGMSPLQFRNKYRK